MVFWHILFNKILIALLVILLIGQISLGAGTDALDPFGPKGQTLTENLQQGRTLPPATTSNPIQPTTRSGVKASIPSGAQAGSPSPGTLTTSIASSVESPVGTRFGPSREVSVDPEGNIQAVATD